jgi:hypothetical protein
VLLSVGGGRGTRGPHGRRAGGAEDFHNLQAILANVEKLRCDMYDNALLPVALANKLVSLSDHPSSKILQKFAIESMRA